MRIALHNMNIHTFKDVATSKRASLANEIDEDDEEEEVAPLQRAVEGEEEDSSEKVSTLLV